MVGLLYILSLVLSVQSLVIPEVVLAAPTAISFLVPTSNGGSFLNDAGGGFGEPLNVRPAHLSGILTAHVPPYR